MGTLLKILVDQVLRLLVAVDIDDEKPHVVGDNTTTSPNIDRRLLLVTCQDPDLDTRAQKILQRLRYVLLQTILDR